MEKARSDYHSRRMVGVTPKTRRERNSRMEASREREKKVVSEKDSLRQMLLDMRRKILNEISARLFPSTPHLNDIGDVVDQAGNERERELSLLLTDREKYKLHALDEALEKLEEGTYGTCEDCGDPIKSGRLKAMPLAKFCINCQARIEREAVLQREEEREDGEGELELTAEMWEEEA